MCAHARDLLDVVTVGRVVVDLYPLQDGLATKDVQSYAQYLGGSPTNVAVAAARAGLRSAVLTRTGDDLLHEFVAAELDRFGVATRWISRLPEARTTIALCSLEDPGTPRLQFYRDSVPPETVIEATESVEAARASKVLWVTASGFAAEPSATAHERAIDAARSVVLDLDYRPDFWSGPAELAARLATVLPRAEVVVGNEEEFSLALGTAIPDDPAELAREMLRRGPRLAVLKRGAAGALAVTREGVVVQPAFAVDVVNGLGAGDAFGGQLASGLVNDWPLEKTLQRAAAAGAIVAGRRGCSIAMPSADEVTGMIERATDTPATTGVAGENSRQ